MDPNDLLGRRGFDVSKVARDRAGATSSALDPGTRRAMPWLVECSCAPIAIGDAIATARTCT
jgi:hypothetical protein